jgi:hypothetical protein
MTAVAFSGIDPLALRPDKWTGAISACNAYKADLFLAGNPALALSIIAMHSTHQKEMDCSASIQLSHCQLWKSILEQSQI